MDIERKRYELIGCYTYYRKTSSISRDLYQKLNLKKLPSNFSKLGCDLYQVFFYRCGPRLGRGASPIYMSPVINVLQQPPWRPCLDWANVRITPRLSVSQYTEMDNHHLWWGTSKVNTKSDFASSAFNLTLT